MKLFIFLKLNIFKYIKYNSSRIISARFIIFLIIVFVSACSKNNIERIPEYISEWTEIREESEFVSFFDIDFADDNFGLISGTSGRLFKTVDGGVTWEKIELGVDISLFRTSALNEDIFAVAGDSLFVTQDGGKSFSEITVIQNTKAIWDIHFIDQQTWYGRGAHVYKTTDGGANWEIDLDLDSLQLSFSKIINTENYLYLLNEDGSVFKKSIE